MATKKSPSVDGADPVAAALDAAAEASEQFARAKSELEYRLADIDAAVVEMVQRVYDATPPEYQRTFRVRENGGDEEELPLPEFLRYAMERPRGTRASFTVDVLENLYAEDGDDEDDTGERGEDE